MGLFGPSDITGIDVGAGGIKAVRIRPGRQPKITAASIIDFSPGKTGESAAASLRSLLADKKISRRNVFTLLPGKDLTIRPLTLPKMPLAELREAIRWEAKRHISYPLDSALVEYLITGERREGTVDKYDLVMIAAEESRINERLLPFREAGIAVSVMDANALALRNAMLLCDGRTGHSTLVVDIGAGNMEINVFKEGVLRFSRCLETGGNDITRLIADELKIGLPDAEELKRGISVDPANQETAAVVARNRLDALLMEIRRSTEYYRTSCREKEVAHAVLTGGAVLMKGLPEYFSRALGVPVGLLDPFPALAGGSELGRDLAPIAPRFAAAVGLALRTK